MQRAADGCRESGLSWHGGPSTSSQAGMCSIASPILHTAVWFAGTAQLSFPKVRLVCVKMKSCGREESLALSSGGSSPKDAL